MITFYYHPSPNPLKVALLLEELGEPYTVHPIDTRKGEQHSPEFLAINPNAKTPALTDGDATLTDSNAIMLYLAEKYGKFLPAEGDANRASLLSWLMFVATGIGPYSGQAVHFKHFAPEKHAYAINRYTVEAERHWGILDAHLGKNHYMVGGVYTIADMSVWGWARFGQFPLGAEHFATLHNVNRLLTEINERPAAERAVALAKQHTFKSEMDAEARKAMFPQNEKLSAA
jgi:GST-like protein